MSCRACGLRAVLSAAAALLLGVGATAQEPAEGKEPNKPAKQKELDPEVKQAIAKAVKHLRGLSSENRPEPHITGANALIGLTLLEAGVPANDPAVRRVADLVRQRAIRETFQYSVSLSLMFLDKLGDLRDEPFIDALALRLLRAQYRTGKYQTGGWGYNCPGPDADEAKLLADCLAKHKGPAPEGGPRKARAPEDLPKHLRDEIEAVYSGKKKFLLPPPHLADNSNTQFALLGLWAARRHGIPVGPAIEQAEQRFRLLQLNTGGWGYYTPEGGYNPNLASMPQMTCAGLIGLALGHAVSDKKRDLFKDEAILKALKVVAVAVGTPATDPNKIPRIVKKGGYMHEYYILWTLERTAILFHAAKIGGKDWYKWGAQILLASQNDDGSWPGNYGSADTCFALLFLTRANLAAEVTERIKKIRNQPKLLEPIRDPDRRLDSSPPSAPKSSQAPAPRRPGAAVAPRALSGLSSGARGVA